MPNSKKTIGKAIIVQTIAVMAKTSPVELMFKCDIKENVLTISSSSITLRFKNTEFFAINGAHIFKTLTSFPVYVIKITSLTTSTTISLRINGII